MADSDALRARRKRLHAAGDHGLCWPERCPAALALHQPLPEAPDAPEGVGPTEAAMDTYTLALQLPLEDPRRPLVEAALVLARAIDGGRRVDACARELRILVGYMAEFDRVADKVDELRARRAHSRVLQVLGPDDRAHRSGLG
jgi:hypothetical protein